jgi:threonine dehydratase
VKVSFEDIKKAATTIKPYIFRTLLETSSSSSHLAGFEVFLKFENLQQTGSFKIRGAANKLAGLTTSEKNAGVIAASAGNHAQGVASMAQKLKIKATIVMPELSPLIKVVSTKRFGAEVILKGSSYDEAYSYALELQKKSGAIFIHPFEDPQVIAGQGTIGLEVFEDCPKADTVFIPIGGGGLLSGIATALKTLNSGIRIVGVQSEGADSMARSFHSGQVDLSPQSKQSTIADGIAVKHPSKIMYDDFISKLCDDVITVNDDEIAKTIVFLMERAKTVVEGAGAAGLAGLFSKKTKVKPKVAVAILGGGNIDLNLIERIIDRGFQAAGRIAKLSIVAPDVPGTLNRISFLIAEKKANVLQINQTRLSDKINLRETLMELTLETTGLEHVSEIKNTLKLNNFVILE